MQEDSNAIRLNRRHFKCPEKRPNIYVHVFTIPYAYLCLENYYNFMSLKNHEIISFLANFFFFYRDLSDNN